MAAMRILVVEDDEGIAAGLKAHLQQQGWAVDVTDSVALAWGALRAEPFSLVLLDLGLRDGDGAEVLRRLRAAPLGGLPAPDTPVVIMTARDEVASRIAGLDMGADDYVTKPFDPDELAARMRALLRRAAGRAQPLLACGDLLIDPAARTVTQAGRPVELSMREFGILLALAEGKRSANPSFISPLKLRTSGLRNQRTRRGGHGSTADGTVPGASGGVSCLWPEGAGMGRGQRGASGNAAKLVRTCAALAGAARRRQP